MPNRTLPPREHPPRSSGRWLLGCVVAVAVLWVGGFLAMLGVGLQAHRHAALAVPPELVRGGPFVGAGWLREQAWLTAPWLQDVRIIARGELDPAPGPDVAVVMGSGAVFLDDAAKVKSRMQLPAGVSFRSHLRLFRPSPGAPCEYLDAHVWDQQVTLRGHDGRVRWQHPNPAGVDGIATGDLDGSGQDAVLISYNGSGGVERLAADGRTIWNIPAGNAWAVEAARGAGGKRCVVYSASRGLSVVDAAGRSLAQFGTPAWLGYVSRFSICPSPTPDGPGQIVLARDDNLVLLSLDGQERLRTSLPYGGGPDTPRMTPVKLWRDRAPYLAVATLFGRGAREGDQQAYLLVYVLDPTGQLAYATSLSTSMNWDAPTLAAVPRPDGRGERLLIGGEGKVVALSAP